MRPLLLLLLLCGLDLFGFCSCPGKRKKGKSSCEVVDGRADCSHMSLKDIPAHLPVNIADLDVSHNRLPGLPGHLLERYPLLRRLDAGFNSVTGLEAALCAALPSLRSLSLEHNEVHLLREAELAQCSLLTELNLSSNRLELKGEPFRSLRSLTALDVSFNGLTSAKLGTQLQMPRLERLSLSKNKIEVLQSDDFSYLANSSLRILRMASLPLTKFKLGCFQPIRGIRALVVDGSKLGPKGTSRLCQVLSGTEIRNLSLQNVQLPILTNVTFNGLLGTNLTLLDLSHNKITSVSNGSFQWLRALEWLSLEQNNFKLLARGMFVGLGNLLSLNLRRALSKSRSSSYPIIEDYSFQPLGRLESLWMDNVAFKEITPHTFSGLLSLRCLSLSWSKTIPKTIKNATFISLAGSPLQTLNLTDTAIARLEPGAFMGLGNLTKLLLGHNFISQTLTGAEFLGLDGIQELYMSFNKIITLTSSSFVQVPTLRVLMLGRAISGDLCLDPSPFHPLRNLSILDLSNNNIANVNASLLRGLYQLRILKVQHNNLARLWKRATPGGPVPFLRDLRDLTVLQMDYNGFDEIPMEGLRGLSRLQELSLGGNLLNYLQGSVFDDLSSLRVLRLQKNLITSVRREVFQPAFRNLRMLHMETNPFDCTCDSVLWFVGWLDTTNASIPKLRSDYICNTPPAYFNRSVLHFDPLSCQDHTPFQVLYILSSTAVLTLLVTAMVFHFQGWRIQFYWNVLVSRTLGFKEVDLGENRFVYDAYIIYVDDDLKWVERHLLPLEDPNLRFCLEDRDFEPGRSRLEAIVEMMHQSKKIVFVVSEKLLKDAWCRQYKAHQAIHQVIEDSRDSIVLIFLEDIPDHKLSRTVLLRRGMLRSRCVLHWPLQKERIPVFRQKLRVALGSSNRLQ